MKTRNSHVSNSSSASFVISRKPDQSLATHIKIDANLEPYIDCVIKTIEDLENYFLNRYSVDANETIEDVIDFSIKDDFEKFKKEIENGREIVIVETIIGGYTDDLQYWLCRRGISQEDFKIEDIKVLEGDGGY